MSALSWSLAILVVVYLVIPLVLYLISPADPTTGQLNRPRKSAVVLVLGDLGRSPRMNYHALSIAKCGYDVNLCGYTESEVMKEIKDHPLITIHGIPVITRDAGAAASSISILLFMVRKVIFQHVQLYRLLREFKGVDFLVVQNPPAIPVLGMVRLFNLFMSPRTKVIIDWHNLGYSILALKLHPDHLFVRLYKWYERWFGSRAFVHLTVTVALGNFLRSKFGMNGRRIMPLYDRPASQFKLVSEADRKRIIAEHADSLFDGFDAATDKIVVTSTSYTPDEDLGILLEALKIYSAESASGAGNNRPRLRVIVTGKGPMYDDVQKQIKDLSDVFGSLVTVRTCWLPFEQYPDILGVADVGVSLHQSSSGWDLPMKVIDMFGCGVPVISLKFEAIDELVKENVNGVLVDGAENMARALHTVLTKSAVMSNLKRGAVRESREKWDTNWMVKLGPLFGVGQYRELDEGEESSSSDEGF